MKNVMIFVQSVMGLITGIVNHAKMITSGMKQKVHVVKRLNTLMERVNVYLALLVV